MMAPDGKANEEGHPSELAGGGHLCWSARIIIRVYRLVGMDITSLIANERRFNVLARIYVAGGVIGLVAGVIGFVAGVGGLVAALYGLRVEMSRSQTAPAVFSSQEECEQRTGKLCTFQMCDYVPESKTFEEVCGGIRKGWVPRARQVSTEDEAIAIAQRAIVGVATHHKGEPVLVTIEGDRYVVTFVHELPPGTKGADYDAKVTIDATSGEVLQILVAP